MNIMPKNRAVFLDRDGTIIKDNHYIKDVEKVEFLPNSIEGIKMFNKLGFKCIIVTNQSGVARGLLSIDDVIKVNSYIIDRLSEHGAFIDGIYFCPHYPHGHIKEYSIDCNCRKPKPGLILKAAKELNIKLSESFMIGDKVSDYHAGKNAGCIPILIRDTITNLLDAAIFIEKYTKDSRNI